MPVWSTCDRFYFSAGRYEITFTRQGKPGWYSLLHASFAGSGYDFVVMCFPYTHTHIYLIYPSGDCDCVQKRALIKITTLCTLAALFWERGEGKDTVT